MKALIHPRTPKGARLKDGMHLAGSVIPGFERFCARLLTSVDKFPLYPTKLELLDYGGGNTVFLAETMGMKRVLRVNRESIGLPKRELLAKVQEVRQVYRTIQSCYSDIPGLVLDEEFFIAHGHLLGMSALVTSQPYLEGEIKCFFNDYSEKELLSLMAEDTNLRKTFSLFADKLLHVYSETGSCVDILGSKNLAIVEEDDQHRLVLLDTHLIYDPQILAERPLDTTLRLMDHIEYIEKLSSSI
ncbi:hypothetical protein ISS85_05560 [Candidatus Microgenomates bacterium]|nr:hypothetical protein [Candidatus Microgenomates bacterium]